MKKLLLGIGIAFALVACDSSEKTEDDTTGSLLEVSPNQEELDAIEIESQPAIVQDFFALDEAMLGEDFCYEYRGISQLILYGNDGDETWSKFEISDNYLTAYHEDCDVLLEFMTFQLGDKQMAFLSQMNRGKQQFNCLKWNESKNKWVEVSAYPRPALADYFEILTNEEAKLVKDYGADFIYINPDEQNARFIYSEWSMDMNMGEKERLEFTRQMDYEFELNTNGSALMLDRISLKSEELTVENEANN